MHLTVYIFFNYALIIPLTMLLCKRAMYLAKRVRTRRSAHKTQNPIHSIARIEICQQSAVVDWTKCVCVVVVVQC